MSMETWSDDWNKPDTIEVYEEVYDNLKQNNEIYEMAIDKIEEILDNYEMSLDEVEKEIFEIIKELKEELR